MSGHFTGPEITPSMRQAIRLLAEGAVHERRGANIWHGTKVFQTDAGATVRMQTLRALQARRLARWVEPSSYALTASGARIAVALGGPLAAIEGMPT